MEKLIKVMDKAINDLEKLRICSVGCSSLKDDKPLCPNCGGSDFSWSLCNSCGYDPFK